MVQTASLDNSCLSRIQPGVITCPQLAALYLPPAGQFYHTSVMVSKLPVLTERTSAPNWENHGNETLDKKEQESRDAYQGV